MKKRDIFVGFLCLTSVGACQVKHADSSVKLVGGEQVVKNDLPSVLIWTTADSEITESYCTGTKIRHDLLLTAGHCVLKQHALPGQVYIGPWKSIAAMQPGRTLTYSFAHSLATQDALTETMEIVELVLPAHEEDCLANADGDDPECQYRAPLPDVAVVRVEAEAGSAFALAPVAKIHSAKIMPGTEVTMCGYGSEGKGSVRLPRLKSADVVVATDEAIAKALQGTEADRDGYPDSRYFFGVISPEAKPHHVNLGSGDSGGPVFIKASGEVAGVNSDGFCPLSDEECQKTNNSLFARLHLGSTGDVGKWLRGIIAQK